MQLFRRLKNSLLKLEAKLQNDLNNVTTELSGSVPPRCLRTPKVSTLDREAEIGFYEGRGVVTLHATTSEQLPTPEPDKWPDIVFLKNFELGNDGKELRKMIELVKDREVETKEIAGRMQVTIDNILRTALRRWGKEVTDILPSPMLNYQFMFRKGGNCDAHVDQFPWIYDKYLPGVGSNYECYNIWVLVKDKGYRHHPITLLCPIRSNLEKVVEEHFLHNKDSRMSWPKNPSEHWWLYWPQMKVGDVILWKSRVVYHAGATVPSEKAPERRESFDLRRLLGTGTWTEDHKDTLFQCSEAAGVEFEME